MGISRAGPIPLISRPANPKSLVVAVLAGTLDPDSVVSRKKQLGAAAFLGFPIRPPAVIPADIRSGHTLQRYIVTVSAGGGNSCNEIIPSAKSTAAMLFRDLGAPVAVGNAIDARIVALQFYIVTITAGTAKSGLKFVKVTDPRLSFL